MWERWNGVDEHGIAHESLNHYSKGSVASFLHRHVAVCPTGTEATVHLPSGERLIAAPERTPGRVGKGLDPGPTPLVTVGGDVDHR